MELIVEALFQGCLNMYQKFCYWHKYMDHFLHKVSQYSSKYNLLDLIVMVKLYLVNIITFISTLLRNMTGRHSYCPLPSYISSVLLWKILASIQILQIINLLPTMADSRLSGKFQRNSRYLRHFGRKFVVSRYFAKLSCSVCLRLPVLHAEVKVYALRLV